jgi:hypothetical protein
MISSLDLWAFETDEFVALDFECGTEPGPGSEAETAGAEADSETGDSTPVDPETGDSEPVDSEPVDSEPVPAPEPASIPPAPAPEPESQCEGGFWRAAEGDACVAWTPCGADLQVSVAGSVTSDQICGVRLVANTVVPEAVDVEAFSAQMAVASGAASMVMIVITSFEQTITSATNVPGSVADYQSTAAQMQFRSGVAIALGVDLSAISELTVTDGRRRRLQDGTVTISYDVVVTDPTVAAEVATATRDTAAFSAALVEAVNDVGGGGLSLDVSSVTVEPPTISTAIEYDIVIQTADAAVASGVQEQLQDTAVMATALSAATGTTISASDVVANVQSEVSSTLGQPDPGLNPELEPEPEPEPEPELEQRDGEAAIWVAAAAASATMVFSAVLLMKKIHEQPEPVSNH